MHRHAPWRTVSFVVLMSWAAACAVGAAPAPSTATPALAGTARPIHLPAARELVLCDGETFDGYEGRALVIDGPPGGEIRDPNVLKIVRNCTFRNSTGQAIRIFNGSNILIENNTFENLRSNRTGKDRNAVEIPCDGGDCDVDGVVIRGNRFQDIGSDGVHLGTFGRNIRNVSIEDNDFTTRPNIGENAIDIKGVDGPVVVSGNVIHGFRTCKGDCSGANGEGIVVHSRDGPATNVIIERNLIYDNEIGVMISRGSAGHPPVGIVIRNNWIFDNLRQGIRVKYPHSVKIYNNTLVDNGATNLYIGNADSVDGSRCEFKNNLFVGSGQMGAMESSAGCMGDHNALFSLGDVRFVDAAAKDFRLAEGSPAIDQGMDLRPDVTDDMDGGGRPAGSAFDLGAYEFRGRVASPDATGAARPTAAVRPTVGARAPSPDATAAPLPTVVAPSPPAPTVPATATADLAASGVAFVLLVSLMLAVAIAITGSRGAPRA